MCVYIPIGLRRWLSGKESTCQYRKCRRHGFNSPVRKIPWRRKWQPTPIFLPENIPWTKEPSGIGMKTDLFQSCGHCSVFQICWHIECSILTASSFRIWNSSAGIPSHPLALFVIMPCLPPGHLPNPELQPRSPALQAVSLPSEPWGKPKNTRVDSLSLLQGLFPTLESNQGLLITGRWATREAHNAF